MSWSPVKEASPGGRTYTTPCVPPVTFLMTVRFLAAASLIPWSPVRQEEGMEVWDKGAEEEKGQAEWGTGGKEGGRI